LIHIRGSQRFLKLGGRVIQTFFINLLSIKVPI